MAKKATINIGKILSENQKGRLPVHEFFILKLNENERKELLAHLKKSEVSDTLKAVINKLERGGG